jgi:hypothetical protein
LLNLIAQASRLTALDFLLTVLVPIVLDSKERRNSQRLLLFVLLDLQADHLQMEVSQHGSKLLEVTFFS